MISIIQIENKNHQFTHQNIPSVTKITKTTPILCSQFLFALRTTVYVSIHCLCYDDCLGCDRILFMLRRDRSKLRFMSIALTHIFTSSSFSVQNCLFHLSIFTFHRVHFTFHCLIQYLCSIVLMAKSHLVLYTRC